MSVPTQIDRIAAAKTSIKASIEGKGITVPSGTKIDGISVYIDAIDTSENLDEVLTEQESIIDQIQAALEGKASAGGVKFASGTITANSKTVTITGLGFTPQHAMLAADSVNTGQLRPILYALNNKGIYDYSSGLSSIAVTFTFTDGGFTVVSSGTGGGYNFTGNYTWTAWAE